MFSVEGSSKLKVPGGKLIIIKLSYSDKIERLQILGDFFLHPEESLALIEDMLIGSPINSTKAEISAKIDQMAKKENIEMIGITPDSIAEAIIMAINMAVK